MLFYTGIFVASLITLLVSGLISKAIISSCKAVARASRKVRSSRERSAITANAPGHQDSGVLSKTVACAVTPGTNNHVTAWKLSNMHFVDDKAKHSGNAVRPPSAAIGASFGGTTKVRRYDGGQKKVTLDMVSRPFRRNAAPDTASNTIERNVDSKIPSRATIDKLIMKKGRPVKSGVNSINKPWGW